MALIKSATFTQISGSVGGATYAHNKGGTYMRSRGGMTNPNSTKQQKARAALNTAIQAWNALTAAQRAAWAAYASATPTVNALGDSIQLSGQNMFARQYSPNTYLDAVLVGLGASPEQNAVDDAPSVNNTGNPVTSIDSAELAAGVLTVTLQAAVDANATNKLVLLQIGGNQNAGKTYFKGPYTLACYVLDDNADTTITIEGTYATATSWLADYQPAVDDRVPMRVRVITDDGRVSEPYQEIVTITAGV